MLPDIDKKKRILTEHRLLMQRQDRGALRAPRLGRVPTVSAGPEHACMDRIHTRRGQSSVGSDPHVCLRVRA
jgi:hypothetical protein